MNDKVPEWLTNLALDIYKLIQQYDAMPRFQEMVNKWASEHEADIERHKKWQEQRELHFEKNVASDPRLKDKQAGPPKKGWEWETYVLHPYEETESGLQRTSQLTTGWVPPKLLISAKPEITHLLPLSREHELTLVEKYTVLAAIYDCGRKGTAKLPPWQWPDISLAQPKEALSNAKKCLFFECLCDSASETDPNNEGWLRSLLNDVEKDVRNWRGVETPQLKENIQVTSSETLTDRWNRKFKNHPVIYTLTIVISVIIILGYAVGGVDTIITFYEKRIIKKTEDTINQETLRKKVYEVARILQDKNSTEEDKKLVLGSLTLHKDDVIPIIIEFAANNIPIFSGEVKKLDPNYLPSLRRQIIETPNQLIDKLFFVVERIALDSSEPTVDVYFKDLLTNYGDSVGKEKEALLTAYYLWRFNKKENQDYFLQILNNTESNQWDPVRKVLLRAALTSKEGNFTLKHARKRETRSHTRSLPQEGKPIFDVFLDSSLEALGANNLENGDIFANHLHNYVYKSLILDKSNKDFEVKEVFYPSIKTKLEPYNAVYLFGFDFYGVPLYNLTTYDVLLGKFFFDKARLDSFEFLKSTLLECDFTEAKLHKSRYANTRFLNCNFKGSEFSFNLFRDAIFSECLIVNALLKNNCFIDTALKSCTFEDMQFVEDIFLNCSFNLREGGRITLTGVIVDKETLDSINACPVFDMSKAKIEEIDTRKTDFVFEYQTYTSEELDSQPPELSLKLRLSDLAATSVMAKMEESDYAVLKSYLQKRRMFIINRQFLINR